MTKPVVRVSIDVELEKEIDLEQLAQFVASRAHTIDGVANGWEVKVETGIDRAIDDIIFKVQSKFDDARSDLEEELEEALHGQSDEAHTIVNVNDIFTAADPTWWERFTFWLKGLRGK